MKDALWIFRSFGFKAGVRYCIGAFWLKIRRAVGLAPKPINFSDLSYEDIEDARDALNGQSNHTIH